MPRYVHLYISHLATNRVQAADRQFTKKACQQIGINFELRFVGEAREGMDGEGVGIDVEEAVLEVSLASGYIARDMYWDDGKARSILTRRPTRTRMWTV